MLKEKLLSSMVCLFFIARFSYGLSAKFAGQAPNIAEWLMITLGILCGVLVCVCWRTIFRLIYDQFEAMWWQKALWIVALAIFTALFRQIIYDPVALDFIANAMLSALIIILGFLAGSIIRYTPSEK